VNLLLLASLPLASAPLLAWRPFLDPLNLHAYWWAFLPPLALGISIAYKAVRLHDLHHLGEYWRQVIVMTLQIIIAMVLLGVAMFLFLEVLLPALAPT
jgi:hypothetical protein